MITYLILLVQAAMGLVERLAPRRPFSHGVATRWLGNFGLAAGGIALASGLIAVGGSVTVAIWCAQNEVGLLYRLADPPPLAAQVVLAFVALDVCMWLQHWIQHKVPFLWRAHRVHHTDLDVDFTTSFRFHPFEAVWAVAWRSLLVAVLGLPIAGVLLYQLVLQLVGPLSHASLRIPERVDAVARKLLVTPDLHRVHHSARAPETDRNFGVVLSVWDRLFRTYQAQPEKGHLDMELGLQGHRDPRALHLGQLLILPFRPQDER